MDAVLLGFGCYSALLGLFMLLAPGPFLETLGAFGCAHWTLHALSHIVDTHHHDGTTVGLLEFAGLAVGTALLVVACAAA